MLHERHAPPSASDDEDDAPGPNDEEGTLVTSTTNTTFHDVDEVIEVREVHPLSPPPQHPPFTPPTRTVSAASTAWDSASSHRSVTSEEQFMTMSREFTAMVAAGAGAGAANNANSNNSNSNHPGGPYDGGADQLTSIGEDELEEHNPLAIVPDSGRPFATPPSRSGGGSGRAARLDLEVVPAAGPPVEASQVKKEEVETKVSAWQTAEIAKINNRFKREEVVINGWETEQVDKASAWLKKIERKLDEQRAKAVEKTQNDVAKARHKAEEKRASAEAKRGLKLAKVLELANFMKAVGRVPTKRSFF
ncbi:hypothetical protein CFC21_080367 [Triticum aestivum]|uniref:Remorin C-terminal domain-containing protein n=3 Tax=Triticinae TaxID=1648030 RepID=A0A453M7E1_AEGTS|nr:remorin 4.1 [Aegilops tauschii subsp. strangulata]XP_044399841.1 remorin 4.1-like [Triticum aestivum]KAF7075604.1 hypothetical protein CFC21_080367 [Triticum aestivum]